MNQSSYITGALLAGFVLFLAANNRLTVYTGVLWGGAASGSGASAAPVASASSGVPSLSGIGSFLKTASSLFDLIGG